MDKSKLELVVQRLQSEGYTDQKIAEFLNGLSNLASEMFYQEAMKEFTEDDLKTIEQAKSDTESNQKVLELYTLRTGKNPKLEMKKFLDQFADGFLTGRDYKELIKKN